MKKLKKLLIALTLIFVILRLAVADVNHGHGPEHHEGRTIEKHILIV